MMVELVLALEEVPEVVRQVKVLKGCVYYPISEGKRLQIMHLRVLTEGETHQYTDSSFFPGQSFRVELW